MESSNFYYFRKSESSGASSKAGEKKVKREGKEKEKRRKTVQKQFKNSSKTVKSQTIPFIDVIVIIIHHILQFSVTSSMMSKTRRPLTIKQGDKMR